MKKTGQVTYIFFDSRHNMVYFVESLKGFKNAKELLKKSIVGDLWDEDIEEETLWENVVLVNDVRFIEDK